MMFDDKEKMNELIRLDPDLPAVKRWITWAVFMPDMADELARIYGTKAERKMLKELMEKRKAQK